MSGFDEAFGEWMATMREIAGVSQDWLANQLQLDQSTVSKLERGLRRSTVEDLVKWATVLDVDDEAVGRCLADLRLRFHPSRPAWLHSAEAFGDSP